MSSAATLPDSFATSSITPASKRELYDHYGLRFLLTFISHRVMRSGPRLLLYLALAAFSLALITKCLPLGLSDFSLFSSASHLWHLRPGATPGHSSSAHSLGTDNDHDALVGGGLRIVVFGENDIASSSAKPIPDIDLDENDSVSWTQVLCSELHCSTYLSFVPPLFSPQESLTNNAQYATAIDKIVELAQNQTPAEDFSFVATAHPPRWEAPDLSAQVSAFLNQSRPQRPPKETLWVFSFGVWDIWALSAYPYDVAEELVSALVTDVLESVELLFEASQDKNSIAYSDYDTSPSVSTSANTTAPQRSSLLPELPWDDSESQPFRLMVPLLVDPSIIPAWHLDRPEAPRIHTKSEQLRNAVRLTQQWNDAVDFQLQSWVKMNENQNATTEKEAKRSSKKPLPTPVNISNKKRRDTTSNLDGAETGATRDKFVREAIIFRPSDYVMDVIIDGQLRAAGIADKKGFGLFSASDSYSNVNTPCLSRPTVPPSAANASSSKEVNSPRAAAVEICDMPGDHLFFTPFSLGHRAIKEIGRFSAAVARGNRTTRSEWEKRRMSVREPDRSPKAWKEYVEVEA